MVEIGCGQGEFLVLLNELGDIAASALTRPTTDGCLKPRATRISPSSPISIRRSRPSYTGDFVCCKMTLEHIPAHGRVRAYRAPGRSASNWRRPSSSRFPTAAMCWTIVAFWDIYYEHCSYFTPVSLRYLFENNGFEVLDLATEYDDQYLMIEARPIAPRPKRSMPSRTLPSGPDRQTRSTISSTMCA